MKTLKRHFLKNISIDFADTMWDGVKFIEYRIASFTSILAVLFIYLWGQFQNNFLRLLQNLLVESFRSPTPTVCSEVCRVCGGGGRATPVNERQTDTLSLRG